jgi:hypothetical protein
MNVALRVFACALLLAALGFGAGKPATEISGSYVEARTADIYTGPCFANAEVNLLGNLAVFGWHVNQGSWQGVKLDGLGVVAAVKASATLGDLFGSAYPVRAVLLVDERASLEQREALQSFARRMSGDLLQNIVRVEAMPISFAIHGESIHETRVTLSAGTLARLETRAMADGDHICGNEETWYAPLTKLEHAMPAVATDHRFRGEGLNSTWSSPDKRSAFVGTFRLAE